MRSPPRPTQPAVRARLVAAVTRHYPFLSGCARVANSPVVSLAAGETDVDTWVEFDGSDILAPLDDLVGRSVYFCGDLDRRVSRIIDCCVFPGDTALDIGANIGLCTMKLANSVGLGGEIHAFEPNPIALNYLEATLAKNGCANVRVHKTALGAAEGVAEMQSQPGNAGRTFLKSIREDAAQSTGPSSTRIAPLNDFSLEADIPSVDFIKIDVEGHEFQVFCGGQEYIERASPRAILFEENGFVRGGSLPSSIRFLKDLSYVVYSVANTRFLTLRFWGESEKDKWAPGDFIAINRARSDEIELRLS